MKAPEAAGTGIRGEDPKSGFIKPKRLTGCMDDSLDGGELRNPGGYPSPILSS
jgi:hypothetical protein